MANLRELGNKCFFEKKYELALGYYSEAIKVTPSIPTLYTNCALCNLKLGRWTQVIEDCQKVEQLDSSVIKSHFFKGQALVELGKYDEAIVNLKKAYELSKQQRKNFGEDITSAVRYAKKKKWAELEQRRLNEENDFLSFLMKLLSDHRDRQLSEIDMTVSSEEMSYRVNFTHKEHERRVLQLTQLFQEADKKRKALQDGSQTTTYYFRIFDHNSSSECKRLREVPDHLCGKISFELMSDPCITPSGITYDRKDIEEHLQRVGHFDPITRQKLTQDQLTSNLAMKEVVDAFISENEWVEDY